MTAAANPHLSSSDSRDHRSAAVPATPDSVPPDSRFPTPDSLPPTRRLPPTSRDFLVYERIIVEQATTRQAAEEFGLSQTRVRQIVHRVEEFLAATLASDDDKARDRGRLRLAECIAADRLHELYTDAVERWNATHESKFLSAVLRLITAQTKLAAQPFTIGALAADAIEGPLSEEPRSETLPLEPLPTDEPLAEPINPPIEDCSSRASEAAATASSPPADVAVNSRHESDYESSFPLYPHGDASPITPAQRPSHAPAAIAEICLTPDEIVLTNSNLFPTTV